MGFAILVKMTLRVQRTINCYQKEVGLKNLQFAYVGICFYLCKVKINLVKLTDVMSVVNSDKDMEKAFRKFYEKLKEVEWKLPHDILKTFNSADILNFQTMNRVVFNIGENKYRLICGYHFGYSYVQLFVKFVGSHEQYDLIDACKIEMFK